MYAYICTYIYILREKKEKKEREKEEIKSIKKKGQV